MSDKDRLITQITAIHRQRLQLEQCGQIDSVEYQELFEFEDELLTQLVHGTVAA